jgi:AraC-like DNA-binding protein
MDVLADVLAVSGVRSTLGARIDAGENWSWWADQSDHAAFHAVTSGTAWLGIPGREPLQLMPGDVVLMPTGIAHLLASDAETVRRSRDHPQSKLAFPGPGIVGIGTGPVRTHVLCAHYEHDPAVETQVLAYLPDLVHIRAEHGATSLDDTVRLLARELAAPQLATSVILDRLVDILLVQLLRVWLANKPEECGASWLAVLGDPMIGEAVAKLHEDPARPWTTATLASEIAVSRATLSRRFPAVVGATPGAYLTRWRMDLAARRLRDTDDPIESIAGDVGYTSVYAFNRAFSRTRGAPPGRYRITSRAALAELAATAA